MHRLTTIAPNQKITLIKEIREAAGFHMEKSPIEGRDDEKHCNLGLKDAKDVAEMILETKLAEQPLPLTPDDDFQYFYVANGYFYGGYLDKESLVTDIANAINGGTNPDNILVVFGYRVKLNTRQTTECTICNI